MKAILLALTVLMTTAAFAGEIKLEEFSEYEITSQYGVTQKFEVNEELSRAWVNFTVSSSDPEGMSDSFRVKVKGLSYDVPTSEVRLELDGKVVTCATNYIKGPRFFKNRVIKMTNECAFKGQWKTVTHDDGFEIKKIRKYEVFLVVE